MESERSQAYTEFRDEVRAMWPSAKVTEKFLAMIWGRTLSRYDRTIVISALRRHRSDDWDATAPSWKIVCREAAGGSGGGGENSFANMLRLTRKLGVLISNGVAKPYPGIQQMSDADVWHVHLRIECQQAIPRLRRIPDEDRRAIEQRVCARQYEVWRQTLEDEGHSIPSYLAEALPQTEYQAPEAPSDAQGRLAI
jgi:hypothetical protein